MNTEERITSMFNVRIHNQGHELRADSRDVARFFDMDHENLRDLITKNQGSFEALGVFRFETGKPGSAKGGRPDRFAYLTEPQVAFLLTLTRNTGRTTELKLQLIQRFQRARAQLRPVDSVLLTIPDDWQKVFSDDFYSALLKLYGDEFSRSRGTPSWVGNWTNRYIYTPLLAGLPSELKAKRKARSEDETDAAYLKLHQFLEQNAKTALDRHVLKVTALLEAATTPEHFRELFTSVFHGESQLLFKLVPGRSAA